MFEGAYPHEPARFAHQFADHPLLTLDALAKLAARMRPDTLEHNAAIDVPLGTPTGALQPNGLTTLQTIERIDSCGSWVLLREIEQDPVYAALMREVLGEVRPIVEKRTGPMHKLRAFVFISSPQAVTQPHFDPEYNILFQIKGAKTMTLFPTADTEIVGQRFFESYFTGGQRYLPWRDEHAARGMPIRIVPGESIFVPIFAPHHVKVHEDVSVSLSLTWCSDWCFEHIDAHKFNRRLRRIGLRPAAPRLYPGGNRLKSIGQRVLERLQRPAVR
ncbi:cupin-like domain-containing protein [Sphingobium cloacae]|nr:cupin-like domain-containing protein [Sphingobium cloacae]